MTTQRTPSVIHKTKKKKKPSFVVAEWVSIFLFAILAAFLLRTYVVEAYYIPSGSMEPTLMVGDRILVNKLAFDFSKVHRGEIVVFRKTPGDLGGPKIKDLVKRVIGLPGETISSSNGKVMINGKPLKEPWLPKGVLTRGIRTQKIPPHQYFLLGDNRSNSLDSRFFGPVPKSYFIGQAFVIFWPINRISFI